MGQLFPFEGSPDFYVLDRRNFAIIRVTEGPGAGVPDGRLWVDFFCEEPGGVGPQRCEPLGLLVEEVRQCGPDAVAEPGAVPALAAHGDETRGWVCSWTQPGRGASGT